MSALYYRWDYLKLQFTMEPDRFHSYREQLERIGEERIGVQRFRQAMRVKAGGEVETGKRRYWITVQGPAANVVTFLPFSWWPFVHRLDVKTTDLPLTDDEVHDMRVKLLGGDNPYNIVAMNSRDRQKDDKRDAGGRGYSIGSHKSDVRVSMYRRGREGVCLEYQCKDDVLDRLLKRHAEAFPPGEHGSTFWLTLKDDLIRIGEQRYARSVTAAGLDPRGVLVGFGDINVSTPVPDPLDPPFFAQGALPLLDHLDASTDHSG